MFLGQEEKEGPVCQLCNRCAGVVFDSKSLLTVPLTGPGPYASSEKKNPNPNS